MSYSVGASQFTLYGNVIDGSTCNPIVGAVVSAPYNSNTTNITNSTGGYILLLGSGSWNVTVSKPNYMPIKFITSYHQNGAYQFNTYLLKPGSSPANCTANRHSVNSTVPSTITANSTVSSTALPTTTQQSNNQTGQNSSSNGNKTALVVGGAIVLIIILVIVAYFALNGKNFGKQKEPESAKAQPKDEKKDDKKQQ
ncbi:MAG: carboxypeptidase regulatory-like domain-containing protein [Candidatus Micrarchaeota archaeon]|nr:carboxypeptidase regulatory-like domain-containing protein [Candidatus Micrarchaeota archaeon]